MKFGILILTLVIMAAAVSAEKVQAQTRLGLHVTQEELDIWKQRAVSGPYRVANDAGASSTTPGDWARIVANKDSFMANASAEIWAGYTGTGCVPRNMLSLEPQNQGHKVRDAAFYALVQNDATVKAAVLSYLRSQIAQAGADFLNKAKWCPYPDVSISVALADINPGFFIAEWLTRVLYAYDYIRSIVGTSDKANIDRWFSGAAYYFRHVDVFLADSQYGGGANFLTGTLNASGNTNANSCGGTRGQTHINGNDICGLGHFFNNRRAQMTAFYAQAGILLNDSTLKAWGKRYVMEYLKYAVFPSTAHTEMYRSHGTNADQGWSYSAINYSKMLEIADSFARNGDMDLYNLSTTAGGGTGGLPAKTLKTAAHFFVTTTQGTWLIYNWNTSATAENLIDGVWCCTGGYYTYDVWLTRGNIFWRDPGITAAYVNPGATNKQGRTSIQSSDYGWTGGGRTHPGMLFMFGQMEGKVWPYPTEEPSGTALAAPTNLKVTSE
jgi:hypothetical protein